MSQGSSYTTRSSAWGSTKRQRSLIYDYLRSDAAESPTSEPRDRMLSGPGAMEAAHELLLAALPEAYAAIDNWLVESLGKINAHLGLIAPARQLSPYRRHIIDMRPETGECIIYYRLLQPAHGGRGIPRSVSGVEIGYAPESLTIIYAGGHTALKYDDPGLFPELERHVQKCQALQSMRILAARFNGELSDVGFEFLHMFGAEKLDQITKCLETACEQVVDIITSTGYRDREEEVKATSRPSLSGGNPGHRPIGR